MNAKNIRIPVRMGLNHNLDLTEYRNHGLEDLAAHIHKNGNIKTTKHKENLIDEA